MFWLYIPALGIPVELSELILEHAVTNIMKSAMRHAVTVWGSCGVFLHQVNDSYGVYIDQSAHKTGV